MGIGKMKRLFIISALFFCCTVQSQQTFTGEVDYPYLGIRFTIPPQWKGAEQGDFLVLVSDTQPGLIGLTLNDAKEVTELKAVADEGWFDDGVMMTRSGDFTRVGAEGMAAEFSGTFQGAQAKAYIAGIVNPHGQGVTIIALTSAERYGQQQVQLVEQITDSLQFALPLEAKHNPEWRKGLAGRTLSYRHSAGGSGAIYSDSSGQSYGSYSSYSSRSDIHLCSSSRFVSSSSSMASFDASGGFGSTHNAGSNEGVWQVITGPNGESVLKLNYADGNFNQYVLDFRDNKTFLDGTRYYRVGSQVCD